MKKIIHRLLFFVLMANAAAAQNKQHDFIINFGVASGEGHRNELPEFDPDNISTANFNCEYFFSSLVSAGLYTSFTNSSYKSPWPLQDVNYKDVWRGCNYGTKLTFHISSLLNEKLHLRINPKHADLYVT